MSRDDIRKDVTSYLHQTQISLQVIEDHVFKIQDERNQECLFVKIVINVPPRIAFIL